MTKLAPAFSGALLFLSQSATAQNTTFATCIASVARRHSSIGFSPRGSSRSRFSGTPRSQSFFGAPVASDSCAARRTINNNAETEARLLLGSRPASL
jgi:hypothetical protein